MYAKLTNGRLTHAPRVLKLDSGTIFNPSEETLKSQGYKPIVDTPSPTPDEGFYYVPIYKETETEILTEWEIQKIPDTDIQIAEKILRGDPNV